MYPPATGPTLFNVARVRIAQIELPGTAWYHQKSRRIDFEGLREGFEVAAVDIRDAASYDVAIVYASSPFPANVLRSLPPAVVSVSPQAARWRFRGAPEPAFVVSPLAARDGAGRDRYLPESVEDSFFDANWRGSDPAGPRRIGSIHRDSVRNVIEQTNARLQRTRDDVEWIAFPQAPPVAEMERLDVWVDPATAETDFDGGVAEALVTGVPVIASRTPINQLRLEAGRTGLQVIPGDPNELTHAILAALFKPETMEPRLSAARQTRSRFRRRHRLRILEQLIQSMTR